MNVLALGAHFDDIELGCGGALARHRLAGDQVWAFVATRSGFAGNGAGTGRSSEVAAAEGRAAAKILDVTLLEGAHETLHLEFEDTLNFTLVRLIEEHKIDTLYTHWQGDVHHDHRALHLAALHAGRHVPRLLLYRSNWYTGTEAFVQNFFVDITDVWEKKKAAISAHQSELHRVGDGWLTWAHHEAETAGKIAGVSMAEGFSCVRWRI